MPAVHEVQTAASRELMNGVHGSSQRHVDDLVWTIHVNFLGNKRKSAEVLAEIAASHASADDKAANRTDHYQRGDK
ncbi:hypothetical protein CEXT_467141 [Caerostris extrusa]|uniref:Uncharacterized protein n=1 Tax=Caerostris extrusa TaxID=172846 RepID=A0AAV4WDJ0_CAEEX|nr:hypothetical protein CEXT_467141 [Caerostris extrusa]